MHVPSPALVPRAAGSEPAPGLPRRSLPSGAHDLPASEPADRPWLLRALAAGGLDVAFERASGCWLEHRVDGRPRRVLDLAGGFGAAFLGHHPPTVVAAARAALAEGVPVLAQASRRPASQELAARLCRQTARELGGRWVAHLLNTGSEAVDAAIRHAVLLRAAERRAFARRLRARLHALAAWYRNLEPGARRRFLEEAGRTGPELEALRDLDDLEGRLLRLAGQVDRQPPVLAAVEGGYHGSTLGAAALGRGTAGIPWPPVLQVPRDEPGGLRRLLETGAPSEYEPVRRNGGWALRPRRRTPCVAFFFEPVQGEGGVHPLDPAVVTAWLRDARSLGVPVVADEIQTGLGRCGAFLAVAERGLLPDAVLLGKTLGGGVAKVAAVLFRRDRYLDDFPRHHGSTFAGDELSSRVALAALELLQEERGRRLRRARRLGRALRNGLRRLQARWPAVLADVRGEGLLLGVELAPQAASPSAVLRGLDEAGVLALLCAGWLLWEEGIRVAPTLHAPRVLRIEPPVDVPARELRRTLTALDRLCGLLARGDSARLLAFLRGPKPAPSSPGRRLSLAVAEQRWWETRGRSPAHPLGPPPAPELRPEPAAGRHRVAFLCHWIDAEAVRCFDPALAGFTDEDLARVSRRASALLPRMTVQDLVVPSATGAEVECRIHGWLALPGDLLQEGRGAGAPRLLDDLDAALQSLAAQGYRLAGLGGLSSVLTRAGTLALRPGVALTTGNALTLGMGLRALEAAAREAGLDPARETVAVVGAAGNIGRLAAQLLAEHFGGLLLVGHPRQAGELAALAARLARSGPPPRTATDPAAIREVRLVFSATNAPKPVLGPACFRARPAVVLDLAVPGDVEPAVPALCPGVRVVRGGIVRLPGPAGGALPVLPGWYLPPGHVHACLAETLLLGLEGRIQDFAVGPLRATQVREALALADRHGFTLAMPQLHPSL